MTVPEKTDVTVLENRLLCRWYPETRTQGFTHVDGTIAFYNHVQRYARDARTILDLGCGRGRATEDQSAFRRSLTDLRSDGRRVIGLDVDPIGAENPSIDEFRMIRPGEPWPVDSDSVSVIVADWVAEHLEHPSDVFREAARVLRKGGVIGLRTPNLLGYQAAISRLIPNVFHAKIVKKVQGGSREDRDVFPTYYRANTVRRLRHFFQEAGLIPTIIGHEPEPLYLLFSSAAFALGVFYQRHAPTWARNHIFAFGQKP